LPESVTAIIDSKTWPQPALFQWLQKEGQVADAEMHRVFNCGIGMVVIVDKADADEAMRQLAAAGEQVFAIGRIEARQANQPQTIVA
jgi:phosphoribosylformylglycinamidine cyclo-ligase